MWKLLKKKKKILLLSLCSLFSRYVTPGLKKSGVLKKCWYDGGESRNYWRKKGRSKALVKKLEQMQRVSSEEKALFYTESKSISCVPEIE